MYSSVTNAVIKLLLNQQKIKLITSRWKGERLPVKVVIDEVAQALCFSDSSLSYVFKITRPRNGRHKNNSPRGLPDRES